MYGLRRKVSNGEKYPAFGKVLSGIDNRDLCDTLIMIRVSWE
jgi:hypothetical protein